MVLAERHRELKCWCHGWREDWLTKVIMHPFETMFVKYGGWVLRNDAIDPALEDFVEVYSAALNEAATCS